ncbi:MAG: Fluoride ion transporter CrcB [uncultured Rubrobacteraceae bacterium]|uniref:Fluoride-specific ion channel FluC n=1 Tax=uncultured Rubrobacteraceae bacterium TaxID=349277 RepID=A0A6J4QEB9_9ACTN|nr:MAG: Fluoride ion transporter CrcB [uncultured Rubrobacteraceae bacterium]
MNVLLVALGGAIGSAARHLVGVFVANRFGPDFPWGTFIVNVSGSFLIGVILSLVGGGQLPAGARLFLAVGVMGGYTTFSTYSNETLQLIQGGEFAAATFNALGQVVAGLVGVYLGVVLGRALGGT